MSISLPPRRALVVIHPTHPWKKTILWALLGFTTVIAGVAGAGAAYFLPQQILPKTMTPEELSVFRSNEIRTSSLDHSLHILIMGIDGGNPNAKPKSWTETLEGRSDTMMLARFDLTKEKIYLLSIPRDTQTEIPGHGLQKINAANALGGPALSAQTVSTLFNNVPIDRYVRLNPDGIVALIDAIGGVEVYVPERMKYTDVTQKLYIDLQPGWQRLNGQQVHQFVRFRHDQLGDIGRVQRQQELIRAVSKELLKPTTWAHSAQILDAIKTNIDTNLTWEELLGLAKFILSSKKDQLDMVMLPGRFSRRSESSLSYWIPDPAAIDQVAARDFGATPRFAQAPDRPMIQLRVAVQNASGQPGMARKLVQALRRKGFTNVFAVQDQPQVLATTLVIAQQGDGQGAAQIQQLLGLGETNIESTGTLESDITIKVGKDWAGSLVPGGIPSNGSKR